MQNTYFGTCSFNRSYFGLFGASGDHDFYIMSLALRMAMSTQSSQSAGMLDAWSLCVGKGVRLPVWRPEQDVLLREAVKLGSGSNPSASQRHRGREQHAHTLHYITLHYITLHYITLHYTT